MTSLSKGDKAPEFHGLNQNNETISLETFKGKKAYFVLLSER